MEVSIDKRETLQKKIFFKGTPKKLDYGRIRNAQNAIDAWECLRYAEYLDVHSDSISSTNKEIHKKIRLENYSFLDKLTSNTDKNSFITAFCEFTGFPNLNLISEKMNNEFKRVLNLIHTSNSGYYKVVDSGYDPTCSVGQKKAFPGSDLDKAYIILKGGEYDTSKVSWFSGRLWKCLDQRLVSLNHPDTFPEIYTDGQVKSQLSVLDYYTQCLLNKKIPQIARLLMRGTLKLLLKPMSFNDIYVHDQLEQKMVNLVVGACSYPEPTLNKETNPKQAAKFNIDLARILPIEKRKEAKSFAFFIEIVKANYRRNSVGKDDELYKRILASDFARYSNVTQVEAWQEKLNSGYMKTKLKNRVQLEKDFYMMTTNDKYDLIKDIIKSSSNDQSDERFSYLFKNDDDIGERYKSLLLELE